MQFKNPYENVRWESVHKIHGTTHTHCWNANILMNLYNQGIRHMSPSNYWPSKPIYPLDSHPGFAAVLKDDMIGCPNAEHHRFSVCGYPGFAMPIHVTAPGSTFASGSPQGQLPGGVDDTWQHGFQKILDHLLFPDGGGIIINHPSWPTTGCWGGGLPLSYVLNFMDFDTERVLGIEISNGDLWALEYWDDILITGRRCWGFAAPDHTAADTDKPFRGRSVLLVDNATEYDCLRAYRTGAFYAKIYNTDLVFKSIHIDSQNQLVVETENTAKIHIIADGAVKKTVEGNHCTFDLSQVRTYCRVEAHSEEDSIFSNPIMIEK